MGGSQGLPDSDLRELCLEGCQLRRAHLYRAEGVVVQS